MLALAFECAGQGLSAALCKEGAVVSTAREDMDRGQPARLVAFLHELMETSGYAARDLDRVACTLGPGGFTGIRLGISVGLGLARASGATFHGINAFDVYAAAVPSQKGLCIAIESRRAEVFARVYSADGTSLVLHDGVITPADLSAFGPFRTIAGSAGSKVEPNTNNAEPDMAIVAQGLSKPVISAPFLLNSQDESAPIYLRAPEIGQKLSP